MNKTVSSQSSAEDSLSDYDSPAEPEPSPTPASNRPQRNRRSPAYLNDYEVEFHMACISEVQGEDSPRNFQSIAGQNDEAEWRTAIKNKLQSMEENKTWEIVKRTPGMRLLTSRWVFRKKSEADGSLRFKARLVARGFLQREGIDFS